LILMTLSSATYRFSVCLPVQIADVLDGDPMRPERERQSSLSAAPETNLCMNTRGLAQAFFPLFL